MKQNKNNARQAPDNKIILNRYKKNTSAERRACITEYEQNPQNKQRLRSEKWQAAKRTKLFHHSYKTLQTKQLKASTIKNETRKENCQPVARKKHTTSSTEIYHIFGKNIGYFLQECPIFSAPQKQCEPQQRLKTTNEKNENDKRQ